MVRPHEQLAAAVAALPLRPTDGPEAQQLQEAWVRSWNGPAFVPARKLYMAWWRDAKSQHRKLIKTARARGYVLDAPAEFSSDTRAIPGSIKVLPSEEASGSRILFEVVDQPGRHYSVRYSERHEFLRRHPRTGD